MARKVQASSDSSVVPPPRNTKESMTTKIKVEVDSSVSVNDPSNGKKRKATSTVKTTKRAKKSNGTSQEEVAIDEEVKVEENANGETKVKVKQTRKTKKGPEPPLEDRTNDSKLRVGAHVSIAGGVHHSITNVLHIGANAFALFLKNQRKWENPALDPEHAKLFIDGCKSHGIEPKSCCVPHGSYLVNLAHPDEERKTQAYTSFLDDLKRCATLGIRLYNFHPGNSSATTREDGIKNIAASINKAHKDPETGKVIALLETMASLGNTVGGTFEDLAEIIEHVENKDRVGVCLDTCHVFAAGYDLRTPEAFAETMAKFDEVIGLNYLRAFHVNDSKAPLASHRDLHARIGTGYLGLRAFHNLVNDRRFHGTPMVLETPVNVKDEGGKTFEDKSIWAREIKMLESLVGMDTESEVFKTLESTLYEEGTGERERIGDQVDRRKAKANTPKRRKSKKKVESEDEADDGVGEE